MANVFNTVLLRPFLGINAKRKKLVSLNVFEF
jgi:hypothetical protein